jgi:hypothetical protein
VEQSDKGRDGGKEQAQCVFGVSFATLALSLREYLVAFLAVRACISLPIAAAAHRSFLSPYSWTSRLFPRRFRPSFGEVVIVFVLACGRAFSLIVYLCPLLRRPERRICVSVCL